MKYKAREVVKCPHCGKQDDDAIAEDLVVQGPHHKPFHKYVHDCGWCDRLFTVERLSDDDYDVVATSGTYDDLRKN